MIPILVVAGPTAAGKTGLAIELAAALEGQIISADSRQVYRRLDVGTAKPTPEERRRVRHHLVGFLDPRLSYDAGSFAADAAAVIGKLAASRKTPIICGGTGFYIEALLSPMFEQPPVDSRRREEVRLELKEALERQGAEALHRKLAGLDPASAGRLHPNDAQRISRALELYYLTGRTMTELHAAAPGKPVPYRPFRVLLDPGREVIEENIARRTERMLLGGGWLDEVEALLAGGLPADAPGMQSLGYSEVAEHLAGRMGLDETLETIKRKTRQYAKRQRTWFARIPAGLHLTGIPGTIQEVLSKWRSHLEGLDSGKTG
ncbi:MAG: tRNA (adenosine(37)-N6)-dimethylallyltransferase MiaA [Gemmatimonadota bacterium]|nr:tRNA (adenosine(37)-N6)-dimethylallyltransferase MiaA [Gemmatimonadota bacterium]